MEKVPFCKGLDNVTASPLPPPINFVDKFKDVFSDQVLKASNPVSSFQVDCKNAVGYLAVYRSVVASMNQHDVH